MQIKTKFDQEQLKNKFKKTISVKNQIWVEKKYNVSNKIQNSIILWRSRKTT